MNDNELLTVPEACRALRVSQRTLYNILKSGTLKAKKIGRRTYILRSETMRFVADLPDYNSDAA
jgi:excisionase family DNA binding protein